MGRLARRDGDGGAAAVEFALVLPILLLLAFGIISFGVIFSQQSTLNNAVREGARRAVVNEPFAGQIAAQNPRTCDGIITSIKNKLSGLNMNNSAVQVKVTQDGWTNSNSCGSSFQSTTFGAASGNQPCIGSFDTSTNAARSIVVEVQYASSTFVAFPPIPKTVTLTSKAVYRCEYSF